MAADEVEQPAVLRVKNTFLELIDPDWPPAATAPLPGRLVRAHTAPSHLVELVADALADGDGACLGLGSDPSEASEDERQDAQQPAVRAQSAECPRPAGAQGDASASCARAAWLASASAAERGACAAAAPGATPAAAAAAPAPARACPELGTPRGPPGPPLLLCPGVPEGAPLQAQKVYSVECPATNRLRKVWVVDARKLRGNDKQAVSPSFDLVFSGRKLPFKLMIFTKQVTDHKGGASFKKSHGRGNIQVKCEADLTEDPMPVEFWICIGCGETQQPAKGPFSHDFSQGAVCMLPEELDEWDFSSVVDQASSTFMVCLEVQL